MKVSKMSYLTKKALFFMVLSISCNPTFSDKIGECITNVHKVFNEGAEPLHSFKIAMFSLSKNVIHSMKNTAKLLQYFEKHQQILQYNVMSLTEKHQEMLAYFRSVVNGIENKRATLSDSEKKDIIGYFNSLVSELVNYPELFQTLALSPAKYCHEVYGAENLGEKLCKDFDLPMCNKDSGENKCKVALAVMFRRTNVSIEELQSFKAFDYVYQNYTHLSFTKENMFPASDSSSSSTTVLSEFQNTVFQKLAVNVMVTYFDHLLDVVDGIILHADDYPSVRYIFPTVEKYCRKAVQNES